MVEALLFAHARRAASPSLGELRGPPLPLQAGRAGPGAPRGAVAAHAHEGGGGGERRGRGAVVERVRPFRGWATAAAA